MQESGGYNLTRISIEICNIHTYICIYIHVHKLVLHSIYTYKMGMTLRDFLLFQNFGKKKKTFEISIPKV